MRVQLPIGCLAILYLERAGATDPTVTLFHDTSAVPARDPSPPEDAWPPPPPYSNVAKDLGAAAAVSVAACEAACVAYRNDNVSPVSGWTRCQSFTRFAPNETAPARCVAVVDAEEWRWSRVAARGAVAGRVDWPLARCENDADCGYNGACDPATSACACDAAWEGDRCQTLALLPATRGAGLRMVDGATGANVSSWGGAVLLDADASPPRYHMWALEMADACGLEAWRSNSRVVHATSDDGVFFARREVVFDAFAHEPTVARAPTGEWVMWFTGEADDGTPPPPRCSECAGGTTPANTSCATGYTVNGPTYLSWAASPDGPWSAPARLFAAQANATNADTNLAAAIRADGAVVGIARTSGDPTGILAHLVTARDWRDADSYVGRWDTMLFPNTTLLPYAGVEDPFVWADPDRAGVVHAVFHNQIEADDERLCGAHAWSDDGGANWTFGGTAWSNRVPFVGDDGDELYRFSRRERPHLVFDARGAIVALVTGVQFGAHAPTSVDGEDACYTLLQPVRRARVDAPSTAAKSSDGT